MAGLSLLRRASGCSVGCSCSRTAVLSTMGQQIGRMDPRVLRYGDMSYYKVDTTSGPVGQLKGWNGKSCRCKYCGVVVQARWCRAFSGWEARWINAAAAKAEHAYEVDIVHHECLGTLLTRP